MATTMVVEVPQLGMFHAAISEAACVIKQIVLSRIGELENRFPLMPFATEHIGHVSSDAFGDHLVYKKETRPGIPLTSRRSWWTGPPYIVVLTPEGILKFPYVMASGSNYPHFSKGVANDHLWVQFGESALILLYPRSVTTVMRERDVKGLVADIGQEYCRYCQHVALAWEFRLENRCPGCGGDSWLAQYGVDAE